MAIGRQMLLVPLRGRNTLAYSIALWYVEDALALVVFSFWSVVGASFLS